MDYKVKHPMLGNLHIYIASAHKVRLGDKSLFRKLSQKSAYLHILNETKKSGIINAMAHNTHTSYNINRRIVTFSAERYNSRLAMVVQ